MRVSGDTQNVDVLQHCLSKLASVYTVYMCGTGLSSEVYQATDRDSSRNGNNRIRYSLVTDRSQLFNVDAVTGELTLKRDINFQDGDENGRSV